MTQDIEKLLRGCSHALNEIPNTPLRGGEFKNTYEIASQLSKLLRELPAPAPPEFKEPTNDERATRAARTLQAYETQVDNYGIDFTSKESDETVETVITDFLSDLKHLLTKYGYEIDLHEALKLAQNNFWEESREQRKEGTV